MRLGEAAWWGWGGGCIVRLCAAHSGLLCRRSTIVITIAAILHPSEISPYCTIYFLDVVHFFFFFKSF